MGVGSPEALGHRDGVDTNRVCRRVVVVLSIRPTAADLVFQLYGRVVHPELFEIHASRSIDRGSYTATISITTAGHLLTWRRDGLTLTEVTTAANQPLPLKRRLLSHRIVGERGDRLECRGGVTYQTCFQLETVTDDVLWSFQQELVAAGTKRGLLHRFQDGGRLALGAVSFVDLETRPRGLLVQAFHTFPEDRAVVKSQSLFEFP